MEQFTYERNGVEYTFNFNPELYGYPYVVCQCTNVKFRRTTDDSMIELWFNKNGENMTLNFYEAEGGEYKRKNQVKELFPENHISLGSILDKYNANYA
jgi:hypothetical protein